MSCNRLCGVCGKSFPTGKSERASSKLRRPVCSDACSEKAKVKLNKCIPHCAENTKNLRDVTFSNGTTHCQEFCFKCFRTRMVPRTEYAPILYDYELSKRDGEEYETKET